MDVVLEIFEILLHFGTTTLPSYFIRTERLEDGVGHQQYLGRLWRLDEASDFTKETRKHT